MTKRRRWSDNLEAQRGGAETAAREAAQRLEKAEALAARLREVLVNNPALAECYLTEMLTLISQSSARQERIIRLMIEAAHGLND